MKSCLRVGRFLVVLSLLSLLAACGPGVGGSGTGDGDVSSALGLFGAAARPVCGSAFAAQLDCPPPVVIGPSKASASNGTELIRFSDRAFESNVTAEFKESAVVLESTTEGLRFVGDWGESPLEPGGRFYGRYTVDGITWQLLGSLEVNPAGEAVVVTLRDGFGRVVMGPVPLRSRFSRPVIGPAT